MGAQIAGFAGKTLTKSFPTKKIARISGLDPAGNLFNGKPESERLSKEDAVMVDVTHTDGTMLGYLKPDFTVDFFPNGGEAFQPGCPMYSYTDGEVNYMAAIADISACSHIRCLHFFIESIVSKNFIAVSCDSNSEFNSGSCDDKEKIVYGYHMPPTAKGSYYFKTNAKKPFAIPQNV